MMTLPRALLGTALALGTMLAIGPATIAHAQMQLVPATPPPQRPATPPPSARQNPPAQGEQPRGANRPQDGQQRETAAQRRERQRVEREQREAQTGQAPANFPRRLDQRAMRPFFDGRPINARALGGAAFVIRFMPDGRMERVTPQGQVTTGRWRFLGDAYCSRWDGNPAESCHTLVQEGPIVRVVRNTRAVATWSRESVPPAPGAIGGAPATQ